MGKIDVAAGDYLADTAVFADAFNFFLYNGERIIREEYLSEINPAGLHMAESQTASRGKRAFRDILKAWNCKRDDSSAYMLLGIENQAKVHYAMPVRTGLYDFLQYDAQIKNAAQKIRNKLRAQDYNPEEEKEGLNALTSAEYISGFRKTDRLLPVITLVIYLSPEKWDARTSLHELFRSDIDASLLQYIPDYRINLIEPARMKETDFAKFRADFGKVLRYISCSDSIEKLEYLSRDEAFRSLDKRSAEFLNVVTGSKLHLTEEGGKVDVCKGIDDMRKAERLQGRKEGRREGGFQMLVSLTKQGLLSVKDAAEQAGMSQEVFAAKMSGQS